jgi:serine/threonine protein kinase
MSKVFTITEGLENMGALRTGGQGSVYKGRRIGPIISAVKLLPTPIHTESTDDKNYRNFLNEVEKLKKVNEVPNPNVVKILNSGITESGSFPFIEMEFIEGPDLGELLTEPHDKIFTLKEVIKLADQLACALAHCHGVGVKHGDIKSNNIKFNVHSGNYVLLDFGLSIMSDEERRSSMRHAGAIEFMAPEQNEGKMLFQTDVYSYGVILYELLAGTVPFPLKDNGETARNTVMVSHMESPVPDLVNLRKENLPGAWSKKQRDQEMKVPGWLLKLVYKCLEKSPDNRYANGMELHDAIIENSIADIRWEEPAETAVTVTTQEAETIIDAGYVDNSIDSNLMLISKPVFWGLMILLIGFMGFTGYALFNTHQASGPGRYIS